MSKTILILGCGTMQLPALRIAGEMGWEVHGADGNPQAEGRSLCSFFHHVDLKDIDGLIGAAESIQKSSRLDGVFTAGTDFSYSVARVAQALGLPGHSPDSALLATDKVLMRRRFKEAGVPSPEFLEIGSDDNAAEAVKGVPGPWVVKPVDSMGARGVKKVDSQGALQAALTEARTYSRSGRALLESYMEGPEYSLDALIEDGRLIRCGLADRCIVYPPHFIETGHTIPSRAESRIVEALWQTFEQGVRALGLSRGAAKGDVKLTSNGPMIGEIAARLSGGYMSGWTYPLASGIEPTKGALRLAVGMNSGIGTPSLDRVCAEKAIIGIDGTLRRLEGCDGIHRLEGVEEIFLRYEPGDPLSFPRNNVEKAGNVITVGSNHVEAESNAYKALRSIHLELDPSDDRTGAFLDAGVSFPPDALASTGDNPLLKAAGDLWRSFPPKPSRGCQEKCPEIAVLPGIHESGEDSLTDYAGRTPADLLRILKEEGRITINQGAVHAENVSQLQSDFWKALVRGGLAGARWFLERQV